MPFGRYKALLIVRKKIMGGKFKIEQFVWGYITNLPIGYVLNNINQFVESFLAIRHYYPCYTLSDTRNILPYISCEIKL